MNTNREFFEDVLKRLRTSHASFATLLQKQQAHHQRRAKPAAGDGRRRVVASRSQRDDIRKANIAIRVLPGSPAPGAEGNENLFKFNTDSPITRTHSTKRRNSLTGQKKRKPTTSIIKIVPPSPKSAGSDRNSDLFAFNSDSPVRRAGKPTTKITTTSRNGLKRRKKPQPLKKAASVIQVQPPTPGGTPRQVKGQADLFKFATDSPCGAIDSPLHFLAKGARSATPPAKKASDDSAVRRMKANVPVQLRVDPATPRDSHADALFSFVDTPVAEEKERLRSRETIIKYTSDGSDGSDGSARPTGAEQPVQVHVDPATPRERHEPSRPFSFVDTASETEKQRLHSRATKIKYTSLQNNTINDLLREAEDEYEIVDADDAVDNREDTAEAEVAAWKGEVPARRGVPSRSRSRSVPAPDQEMKVFIDRSDREMAVFRDHNLYEMEEIVPSPSKSHSEDAQLRIAMQSLHDLRSRLDMVIGLHKLMGSTPSRGAE